MQQNHHWTRTERTPATCSAGIPDKTHQRRSHADAGAACVRARRTSSVVGPVTVSLHPSMQRNATQRGLLDVAKATTRIEFAAP
jgi:hypothetical protein